MEMVPDRRQEALENAPKMAHSHLAQALFGTILNHPG